MQDIVVVRYPGDIPVADVEKIKSQVLAELGDEANVSVIVVGNGAIVEVHRAPCAWEQPVFAKRA